MIALAVDIGLTGALAAVDHRGTCSVADLPTVPDGEKHRRLCGRGLILLIRQFVPAGESAMVLIEDVRPRPQGNHGQHGNTMHSQGSLMRSRGIVESAVDIARLELKPVQPQSWKRYYGLIGKDKGDALAVARRLFPTAELTLKKHHNRAESLLIAHYGLRKALK